MFFFPEYTLEKVPAFDQVLYFILEKNKIEIARHIFNYQCRRFLGLGFFLSFVPRTNAYLARRALNQELTKAIAAAQDDPFVKEYSNFVKRMTLSVYSLAPFIHFLLLGPLWLALFRVSQLNYNIWKNIKAPFSRIFLDALPIVSELDSDYPGENLLHSLLNPARLVDALLCCIYLLLNRIVEIGSERNKKSNLLVTGLKLFLAFSFATIISPVTIIGEVLDIPYQILKHLVYQPLKFIVLSLAQPFRDTTILQKYSYILFHENNLNANKDNNNQHYNVHKVFHGMANDHRGSNNTTVGIESDNDEYASQSTSVSYERSNSLSNASSPKFFDKHAGTPVEIVVDNQNNNETRSQPLTP